ncbi:glycoside hydrolase family 88 protein [Alkalihalobacillus sp. 1P02AB]|uniref:glycoside hydrolase family 88 protein n=1 Tax=Alkalihalobacillus sp. 1P02AB TaxID=3132260 RepID=UPI0039A599CD
MKEIKDEGIISIEKYSKDPELTRDMVQIAFKGALQKIDRNLEAFTDQFPDAASVHNVYLPVDNTDGWTQSFWTGMLWLAYEVTGDEKYRSVAEVHVKSFQKRIDERLGTDTHDLGFLYSLSCVSAYKLTGSEEAKNTALKAADHLIERYKEKGEFIQAWGDVNDPNNYRLIIDCYLNLPLLYWASEVTGNKTYYNIAYKHAVTAMDVCIREDASTHHTFYFNPKTGEPIKGVTAQGYSDTSSWSRGQAWGIYGFPLSYKYTEDKQFIDVYKRVAHFYLNRLPEDYVPYWDLIFTYGDEERDSSAGSIAVCGFMEAVKWLDENDPMKKIYINASKSILKSLILNYTTEKVPESNGLLLHGVYSKPHHNGIDECNIWGDYYYLEALVRTLKDWELYW